jgi:predicted DNA-binding transcriptional regulator YafY
VGDVQLHQAAPLVERQHALIEALRARSGRPVPAATLAADLAVRVRTVERDVARLREAGIPIGVRRGPGGGYTLDVRSVPDPVPLTPAELAALVSAVVAVGPYRSASAVSALDKLLAAMDPAVSR